MAEFEGKRLLIITASVLQQPVIRKAQSLGLEVVATDRNPDAPGLKIADHAAVIDTLDLDGMLRLARKYTIDGVITEQTDVAVPTAAYVAEKMGLPGIGYEVAVAATNKWLMRERCRAAGIPGPLYRKVNTLDEAVAAAEEIGLPVVIKPVDAQSSRGVAKIWDAAEIPKWFKKTQDYSREGSVLVEELMIGMESSAEGFVIGDEVRVFGICDKIKCPPPYSYDTRLVYPALFSDEVMAEIKTLNEKVVRAIGIPLGITHAEYIVTERGVRLLEIAARGCGARVATHLIPAMTGVDLMKARILQAIGENPHEELIKRRVERAGVLEFLMLSPGRIKSIEGLDKARKIKGVLDVNYYVKAGDEIGVIESGAARPGYLLGVGESREEVLALVEKVKQALRVEMEVLREPTGF